MRRRQANPSSVSVHAAPVRESFVPGWARSPGNSAGHTFQSARSWIAAIRSGDLRIPNFQRPWCWSDEQILLLLDSLFEGFHVGSLIVWERYDLPASTERFGEVEVQCAAGRGLLVVDGQQRLSAIVTAALSGRFFFDLETGCFATGEASAWRVDLRLLLCREASVAMRWLRSHADEYGVDAEHLLDLYGAALGVADDWQIHATTLPYRWSLEQVVRSYERLATAGTPISPDELTHALATITAR